MNQKVKYNFIKRLCQHVGIDLDPEIFKGIALNTLNAEYKSELLVRMIVDSFNYLLSNTAQSFDETIINNAYYLLTGNKLSIKLANKIVNYYYMYLDLPVHEMSCDIHYMILNLRIKKRVEFAFLIMSYLLIRKGYYPIIILKEDNYRYKRAIEDFEESTLDFYSFIEMLEFRVRKQYKGDDSVINVGKEELFHLLISNKEELQERYRLKNMYLFGSLSKDTSLKQSDIDLRVTFKDEWETNKQALIRNLYDYIYQLTKSKIDLVETGECLGSYLRNDFEQQIRIF